MLLLKKNTISICVSKVSHCSLQGAKVLHCICTKKQNRPSQIYTVLHWLWSCNHPSHNQSKNQTTTLGTAHSPLTGNSQSHHCRLHGCYQVYTSICVAVLCSIHSEIEDAHHLEQFSNKRATRQVDTVFKKAEIVPHIHSMIGAGDGEDASFNKSDWSHRIDGDHLGHWNTQHA